MRARLLGIALIATACEKPVVVWSDISYPSEAPAADMSAGPRTGDTRVCATSLRIWGGGPDSVAVWWSIRNDSSSVLMFSRRMNGTWTKPTVADTTDASSRGCDRPAPAIAMDTKTGYVNIAYFLEPATGAGVFFTHSMDETGFHDPVSIGFGKRPSEVSVASSGDRVVVSYEEPNAERGQIWVALSRTMGHIFEVRVPVSGINEVASAPRIRLSGTKLDIQWQELLQADSLGRKRTASRTGTWN